MLILTLTLLSLISISIQDCGTNVFADSCWDDPSIATITYDAGLKCENYDTDHDACAALQSLLVDTDLTSELCEQLCDLSHADGTEDDIKCEYFRWEKDDLHCTLMNNAQCNGGFVPCIRGKCVSGQTGCSGGDSPLPKEATCAAGVVFEAESVHWVCLHPEDYSIHINIYEEGGQVPAGTACQTAHKCKTFDNAGTGSNDLHVVCDAKSDNEKRWEKYPGSPNDVNEYMDGNHFTLLDPKCNENPDPLVLDAAELHKTGVSFVCEDLANLVFTKDVVKVTPPNTCALLCNLHHALTIENELSEDGVGIWNKYDAGSDDPIEVSADNADIVKCWASMEL